MSYSYSTDGDSSDIELVSHARPSAAATMNNTAVKNDSYAYNQPQQQQQSDYADFFAEDAVAADWLPAAFVRPPSPRLHREPPSAAAAAGSTRTQPGMNAFADKGDVIEIDDSDDGGEPARPSGHLRKTHSAPSAVFGEKRTSDSKGKGKARLFEPLESSDNDNQDSDDDDELPTLGTIAARSNILKRSNSDSVTSSSASKRRFKQTDSTATSGQSISKRTLSPIPASSPPPAGYRGLDSDLASRDASRPNKSRALHLPSDLDSSDAEDKPKKKQRQMKARADPVSQPEPTSEAGPSKPPTKKEIAAAKKAQRDKEKADKAEELANLKERKTGMKIANRFEDRQEHCKEISIDISSPLHADREFRDKIWIQLKARFEHLSADHKSQPARPGCFEKVISWRRLVTRDYNPETRYWYPRTQDKFTFEQEKTVLLFLTGQEVEKGVAAYKYPDDADKSDTLLEMVTKVRKVYGLDYQVILLVQNLSFKAKAKKSAENAVFQNEVRGRTGAPSNSKRKAGAIWDDRISMEDIEQELVRLQLLARCSIQRNEKHDEAVDWIAEFTKDIAHRPYKMLERVREMYLNIDGKIESSNRGDLHTTYVNQLACIHGVTEPTARAIAARFSTWKRLRKAFKEAPDPRQTLAGIAILNRVDGAATNKSTGATISERIYLFLNARDPNLLFSGNIAAVRSRNAANLA